MAPPRGWSPSQQTRAKISAANRGKAKPPGWSEAVSAALKGRTFTPEHCAAISAAKLGHINTPAHNQAISDGFARRRAAREAGRDE